MLGLSIWLFGREAEPDRAFYALLLLAAAALWAVAALLFTLVDEYAGETAGGRSVREELARSLRLLVDDAPFRHFVVSRALLMCSGLAAPFLVLLAQRTGEAATLLGAFLVAASLAESVSASVWGWMADASSRRVMLLGGVAAAVTCLGMALLGLALDGSPWLVWVVVAGYFVLSIAHAGVRIGRKTYLVDMAEGNRRTDYVAVSNTVIGVALLVVGALGGLAALVSIESALGLLGLMGLAGVVSATRLPEV